MIFVKPEKVYFENQNDVIDYVTKGLPPRKKDFDKVIGSIGVEKKEEGKPFIPEAVLDMDASELKDVLHRVYEDNRKNYMIGGIVAGSIIVGLVAALIIGGGDDKKSDNEEVEVYEF